MQELGLGPNAALIYCLEYLLDNFDSFLEDRLDLSEGDMLIVDCPGQIEIYTHLPLVREVADRFQKNGISVLALYCLESSFTIGDSSRYFAGLLNAASAMISLETPHLNLLTKVDGLPKELLVNDDESDPNSWLRLLRCPENENDNVNHLFDNNKNNDNSNFSNSKYAALNQAIIQLVLFNYSLFIYVFACFKA